MNKILLNLFICNFLLFLSIGTLQTQSFTQVILAPALGGDIYLSNNLTPNFEAKSSYLYNKDFKKITNFFGGFSLTTYHPYNSLGGTLLFAYSNRSVVYEDSNNKFNRIVKSAMITPRLKYKFGDFNRQLNPVIGAGVWVDYIFRSKLQTMELGSDMRTDAVNNESELNFYPQISFGFEFVPGRMNEKVVNQSKRSTRTTYAKKNTFVSLNLVLSRTDLEIYDTRQKSLLLQLVLIVRGKFESNYRRQFGK